MPSSISATGQSSTTSQPASEAQVQDLKRQIQAQTQGQPWSQKFLAAFDQANIGSQLTQSGAINPGVDNPFNGLSPEETQQAKDAIYNAIQSSPLASAAWGDLYVAGISPDQAQGVGGVGQASGAGSTGGTGGSSAADGTGAQGGSRPYSATSGTGQSQPSTGTGATGGDGAQSATGGGGAQGATQAGATYSAQGTTPSAGALGAQGGSTAAGSAGTAGGSGAQGVASTQAVGDSGAFSKQDLYGYIKKALEQTPGGDNSLSGPQNIAKWDPSTAEGQKNLDSFYDGIVTAQKQFYPEVPLDQFGKFIVAESAQESTLNPDIENGDGVIQANQSVRDDFAKYGKTITDANGNALAVPGQADSSSPGTAVALWAWRTRSSLDHGGNGPAQWGQSVPQTQSANLGNALSVWLQGPASQPFYANGQLDTSSDYVTRVQSFFAKLGGSSADFQKLAGTPLDAGTN